MNELTTTDRLEIAEVLSRYSHCLDRGRWEDFAKLFTSDARLDLSQVMGLYEGAAGIESFAAMMRSIPIVMRHYVTNVVIDGDSEHARVECYVLAMTGPVGALNTATGFYADDLVKQDGRWRIRSRRLTLDMPGA